MNPKHRNMTKILQRHSVTKLFKTTDKEKNFKPTRAGQW